MRDVLVPTSSLTDQELYHQQQQKIVQLDHQLQKLKQLDSYPPLQSAQIVQRIDQIPSSVRDIFFISIPRNSLGILLDSTKM